MQLLVPKIDSSQLTGQELALYKNLNDTPYGLELAKEVTAKLSDTVKVSQGLYHAHRDYCGLGLFYENGTFKLTTVNDGYGPDSTIASSDSKSVFTTWLAKENDQSMSLYGEKFNNQTITKIRLDWYLQANYSPVWNDFCAYLHSL